MSILSSEHKTFTITMTRVLRARANNKGHDGTDSRLKPEHPESQTQSVQSVGVAIHKPPDEPDHLAAGVAGGLHGEEPVVLPLELDVLHGLFRRLEPRDVVRLAVAQQVPLRGHDERGRERDAAQRGALRTERVRERMVPRGARGQRQPPCLVVPRQRQERAGRELRLGRRPLRPAEERAEHDVPGDAHRVEPGGELARCRGEADGDVVDDVPARRVTGDEHPAEVSRLGEPGVPSRRVDGLSAHPVHDGRRVVEGRGEAVLRCEAVVGGEDDGRELGGKAEAAGVEIGQREGAEDVAAAVEVDEHGQLVITAGVRRRSVHAELEVVGGVVHDVLPLDGQRGRHGRRRERVVVGEPDHRAIAEKLEDMGHVLDDVWRRGG